jgi:hypothetical protein
MATSFRSIVLAASIFALPVAGAIAQTTAPTGDHSRLGTPNTGTSAAPTSGMAGGTGKTVVPGNNSTVGADRSATAAAKTGGTADGAGSGK